MKVLGLLVSLIFSISFSVDEVRAESRGMFPFKDSEIFGPPFEVTYLELKTLANSNELIELIVYGRSYEGRDLFAIKVQDKSKKSNQSVQAALITGSTHGNEYLNIADRLPRWFAENRNASSGVKSFLDAGNIIYIIPIFNPDGYENRIRGNANEIDLNRDFEHKPTRAKGFTQRETKSFAEFIDRELQLNNALLSISLDYHCCVGSWLYPWAYLKDDMVEEEKRRHTDILDRVKPEFDSSYYYGTYWSVLNYLAWGTSTDYFYEKYGALSFIFEGARAIEDENFLAHTRMWDIFLGDLSR